MSTSSLAHRLRGCVIENLLPCRFSNIIPLLRKLNPAGPGWPAVVGQAGGNPEYTCKRDYTNFNCQTIVHKTLISQLAGEGHYHHSGFLTVSRKGITSPQRISSSQQETDNITTVDFKLQTGQGHNHHSGFLTVSRKGITSPPWIFNSWQERDIIITVDL